MTNEQIVTRIKAGIDVAGNTLLLWKNNKGYIHKIAIKYAGYSDIEDLKQEGFIGLCDAIEHYDPEEGVLFMTYAGYWIQQKINRYAMADNVVRFPEQAMTMLNKYKKIATNWKKEFNREPSESELKAYLGISKEQLENLKKDALISSVGSLDVPVGDEENTTMYELLPGECFEDAVMDKLQQEQLSAILWPMVDDLPGQQGTAVRERFQHDKTLEEVGNGLGGDYNTARNLIDKAMKELRKPSRSKRLLPFLDDEIYRRALHGNGVNSFRNTWTSSTERVALKMYERY